MRPCPRDRSSSPQSPQAQSPQAQAAQSTAAQERLRQHWGYRQFRPGQATVIQAQLDQRDLLAVMPTGSGKSLCFQLPALCRPGLTLVISPLVALMEDQVAALRQRGIAAAALHSQLGRQPRQLLLRQIQAQQLKLLYLSPETLLSPTLWQLLCQPDLHLGGLVIDEAHCLCQWGDSFRPAYQRLGAVRPALLALRPPGSRLPLAAFTATADRATQERLKQTLALQNPRCIVQSPHRPQIQLQVKTLWTPGQRHSATVQFLRRQGSPSQLPSGLIYVRRRRDSEALAARLCAQGWNTLAYHGGLSPQRRRQIEQAWLAGPRKGQLSFVVCTSAFGMGIDLPSCRWVLHYHCPLLLAEYVQEIGRAGRDGQPAVALALASEPTGWVETGDRQRNQFFLDQLHRQHRQALALAKQLPPQGQLDAIEREHRDAALGLALLHRWGQLQWLSPFEYRLADRLDAQPRDNHLRPSPQKLGLDPRPMARYLRQPPDQRWPFIIEAFS